MATPVIQVTPIDSSLAPYTNSSSFLEYIVLGTTYVIDPVASIVYTYAAGAAPIHLAAQVASHATAVVHTTALTVRNNVFGSTATGVGLADSAATLPAAPVAVRAIGGGPVAASSITPPFIRDEIAGGIIMGPGTNVSLGYLTTAISVVASMNWAEVAQ